MLGYMSCYEPCEMVTSLLTISPDVCSDSICCPMIQKKEKKAKKSQAKKSQAYKLDPFLFLFLFFLTFL